ncbi:MAG: hypothetical protein K6T86_14995, partial [Pirellulales bacterium]|nr:hypothetical protein [Pirellulales bacterium]
MHPSRAWGLCLLVLVWGAQAPTLPAAEAEPPPAADGRSVFEATQQPDAELLAAPIVGAEQGLKDVVQFTSRRVQRLPEFRSVPEWEAYRESLRQALLERVVFRGVPAAWREGATQV